MADDLFSVPFEDEGGGDQPRQDVSRRRVLTVSELTASIRGLIETSYGDIWVEGEISNCRVWNTGHLYFTLKDSRSQLKVVMFRTALRYLQFKAEDGQHVIARGRLGVYDAKGEYQLVCEHLEPRGLGALQLAFEQLKKKLQADIYGAAVALPNTEEGPAYGAALLAGVGAGAWPSSSTTRNRSRLSSSFRARSYSGSLSAVVSNCATT